MVVQIRLWHALPPASARQARDSHAHAESTRVLSAARSKAFVGGSIPIAHRKRTLPARSHAISASAAVPVASRLWHVAAAAAQPTTEALLMQNILGSMCVGAILLVVTSLFSASGRKKWTDFFSNFDNLLPQNPAIKRSVQWLPVIAVAKGLESAFGLPLLNWVYVAYSANMLQVMVGQAKEMAGPAREAVIAGVAEAEAKKAAREQGGASTAEAEEPVAAGASGGQAVNPFGAGFGLNQTAAALFSRRFPELEGETYHATCPVMWREGGKDQQGQLYVTDRSVALHGTFGRGKQIVKLAEVMSVAEISTGSDKMSAFTLATADRGEVTITGVIALGGNALYPTISELWTVGGGATTR